MNYTYATSHSHAVEYNWPVANNTNEYTIGGE